MVRRLAEKDKAKPSIPNKARRQCVCVYAHIFGQTAAMLVCRSLEYAAGITLQPCLAFVLTNSKIYNFKITQLSIIILIVGTLIEIFFIKRYNIFYINGFTNGEAF